MTRPSRPQRRCQGTMPRSTLVTPGPLVGTPKPHHTRTVWPELHTIEPERTRIELFDMIWWMHFREAEPVT